MKPFKDDNSFLLWKVHQVMIREVYYLKNESSILAYLKFKGGGEQSIKHPQLANFTESKTFELFWVYVQMVTFKMLWINTIHLFPRKIFTKLYTILNMRVWQKCKWRQRHIDAHCGPELPSAWVTGPCFASSLPIISPLLPCYVWSLIDFNSHFLYIKVKFIICFIKPPSQPKFFKGHIFNIITQEHCCLQIRRKWEKSCENLPFYFMRPDGDRPVLGKRFKTLIISYLGNHIDDCDCIENNEGCSLKTIWRSAQFRESSRWNAFHNILPILHQIERELGSKLKRVFGEYISTPAILDFRERTFS